MSTSKPRSHINDVGGLDVKLTAEKVKNYDLRMNEMLSEIGERLTPDGMEYRGSYAVHLYVQKNAKLQNKYDMASLTQICLEDVSEPLVRLGSQNATIELTKYFGHAYKTARPGDLRGKTE